MAEEHGPQPKTSQERLTAMLPVLNAVQLPSEPFAQPELPELEGDWRELITRLWFAARPTRFDPDYVERCCRRAKRKGIEDSIKFDCPRLYGAEANGTPTEEATRQLIARLHAALTDLLLPRPARGRGRSRSFIPIPDHADAFLKQHFRELAQQSFTVQVAWRSQQLERRHRVFVPELRITAPGVDTLSWNTLLEFLQDNPNYPEIIGKCPVCLGLFRKPRKDARYCSPRCSAKKRYERWKRRGGLKRRKRRRILRESGED